MRDVSACQQQPECMLKQESAESEGLRTCSQPSNVTSMSSGVPWQIRQRRFSRNQNPITGSKRSWAFKQSILHLFNLAEPIHHQVQTASNYGWPSKGNVVAHHVSTRAVGCNQELMPQRKQVRTESTKLALNGSANRVPLARITGSAVEIGCDILVSVPKVCPRKMRRAFSQCNQITEDSIDCNLEVEILYQLVVSLDWPPQHCTGFTV
eukprot:82127-Rhodomonas_salina.1